MKTAEGMQRLKAVVRSTLPGALKTCIWIVKMTVGVSFGILLLNYFNVIPWISSALYPVFSHFGLPGEAALAYVSGYFVNVYSAIAVAVSLNLDVRAMTILSVMVLCSHNMIIETAVQKKTGSSALRLVLVRTLSGMVLALVLNHLLPAGNASLSGMPQTAEQEFWPLFVAWAGSTLRLVVKMVVIILSLNILQKLLSEFGVIRWLSRLLRPLLKLFGLPARSSFLWIIANVVGLAYGAAAMIDEVNAGKLNQQDIDLTNLHICISHSNLEDLWLFASVGAVWWILLLSRWMMSIILVWGYKLELLIRNKFLTLHIKTM